MMKKLIIMLAAVLVLSGCERIPDTTQPVPETETVQVEVKGCDVGVNLLENGDFSEDDEGWGTYQEDGSANLIFRNGYLQIDVKSFGSVKHGVQVYYDGFRLINSGEYTLSFKAFATSPKMIAIRPQLNGGDYHAYCEQEFLLTEEENTYSMDFTMTEDTDLVPRLAINMGFFDDDTANAPVTITISEVSLVLHNEVIAKQKEIKNILINQIGYLPDSTKTVFFTGDVMDTQFRVINDKGKVVYRGEIGNMIDNQAAGQYTFSGDFSKVTKEGTYYIETTSLGKSESFYIGEDIFHDAFIDTQRMLFLQRCGIELDEKYAGEYAHDVCHNTTARIHGTNDYTDVIGGWHDAGDYGRYVVPGAKTVADLLLAYRSAPEAFDDKTNILESGNSIPDVLDEVRYELEWMLQMQTEEGGVYHKITCAKFPPFVMPEYETEQLLISPVSTCATADFAAVMAMAYEDYSAIDKEFADTCLAAAKKAWAYLEITESSGFRNPMNVVTGEYGDFQDDDERYFAAIALYSATKDQSYHEAAKSLLKDKFADDLGWKDMGGYGNALYIALDESQRDAELYKAIEELLIAEADKITEFSQSDGYHVSIDIYEWGSNMNVLNNAMLLLMANDINPNTAYVEAAQEQANYVYGANALSMCYLTGYGATSAQNPHHRPSIAVGKAMPGMVIGGPDEKLEDATARISLENTPPAKCYVDNAQSYSTNEVTIYWNSPLVYVMARLGMY